MQYATSGKTINFIGDPHLGKSFGGVPLHRRGEREAFQMTQFNEELNETTDVTIMVGDLFDTYLVSNEVLLATFEAIKKATESNPNKIFILISGNHDISRDSDVQSSFHVLQAMLAKYPRVKVFMETTPFVIDGLKMLLCPYSMFTSADDELAKYEDQHFNLVVGHWDTLPIAGPHNLMPYAKLGKMADAVFSGHEHTPYQFYLDKEGNKTDVQIDTTFVVGTGSMQPYSHGEDPHQTLYLTRTLEQVIPMLAEDPHAFRDKCVRLVLGPGEEPPADFDCLQFSIKRVTDAEKEELEVTLGEFDFYELFKETFLENGVPEELIAHYWELYKQKANDDN